MHALLQGEALPGIPFRLNPNPEVPQRSARDSHVLMVDAATSPMMPFDEDSNSNLGPSEAALSAPSTARSVTFLTDQDQDQDQEQEVTTTTKLSSSLLGDKTTANASANANASAAELGKAKTVSILVKKASQGTSMRSLTMAVSFSERPPRKSIPRRVRECSKIGLLSSGGSAGTTTTTTGTNTATTATATAESARELQHQHHHHHRHQQQQMQLPGPLSSESYAIERLPRLPPDTARSRQTLLTSSPRKSASVSDLTDVGSIFSWHDMEFEVRTSRSIDLDSDNVGPTSFFQSRNKSKSLLDLLKLSRKGGRGGGEGGRAGVGGGEEDDSRKLAAADFSAAYHRRQRIAQLAFRRENSRLQRRPSGTLASSEADKEWLEMVNTQVIDKADYDKFASSRKPVTPAAGSSKKHAAYSGPFRPKSGTDFRLSQPAKGKVYPVFFNDGSPVRKFGRALPPKRKLFKSKQ